MLDPMDIDIRFRSLSDGRFLCYSNDCKGIVGEGDSPNTAASSFWKAFNQSVEFPIPFEEEKNAA